MSKGLKRKCGKKCSDILFLSTFIINKKAKIGLYQSKYNKNKNNMLDHYNIYFFIYLSHHRSYQFHYGLNLTTWNFYKIQFLVKNHDILSF